MRALLIVDIQNDFLPGGALGVEGGNEILPIVNTLTNKKFDLIVASKDWHPKGHVSFDSLWPEHCVQESIGSEFPPELNLEPIDKIIYKGTDPLIDSYSAFFDNEHKKATGLNEYLKEKNITKLYIAGLATDYCVKYTTLDALNLGYTTYVIEDACCGVNLNPSDSLNSLKEMHDAGAHIITSSHLPS